MTVSLTQGKLLPGVGGEGEAQDRHGGDQKARHYQVEKVVEGSPTDLDHEGDVEVGLWTAVVYNLVPLGGHPCKVGEGCGEVWL